MILLRHRRHTHGNARQVNALVVRNSTTLENHRAHHGAFNRDSTQAHASIVNQDEVPSFYIASQARVGRRSNIASSHHIIGGDNEGISLAKQDRAFGKGAQTDLGTLKVDQNAHTAPGFCCRVTNSLDNCSMRGLVTVAHIQASHVHTGFDQLKNLLGRGRCGSDRAYDLGSTHTTILARE